MDPTFASSGNQSQDVYKRQTLINPYMGMINDGLTHFLNGMGGASRIVLGLSLIHI